VIAPGVEDLCSIETKVQRSHRIHFEIVDAYEHPSVRRCVNNCGRPADGNYATCCTGCARRPGAHSSRCHPFISYHADQATNMENWEIGPSAWNLDEQNLASFGTDIVLPKIKEMIRRGRGPSAVVCGSRGGDVTIIKVWEAWRGPTVMINASPLRCGIVLNHEDTWYQVPEEVPLYLAAGGNDWYFWTGNVQCYSSFVPRDAERLRLLDSLAPVPLHLGASSVFLYFHPTDRHSLASLAHSPDLLCAFLAFAARRDLQDLQPLGQCLPHFAEEAEVWQIDRQGLMETGRLRHREYRPDDVRVLQLYGEGLRPRCCDWLWRPCADRCFGIAAAGGRGERTESGGLNATLIESRQ